MYLRQDGGFKVIKHLIIDWFFARLSVKQHHSFIPWAFLCSIVSQVRVCCLAYTNACRNIYKELFNIWKGIYTWVKQIIKCKWWLGSFCTVLDICCKLLQVDFPANVIVSSTIKLLCVLNCSPVVLKVNFILDKIIFSNVFLFDGK